MEALKAIKINQNDGRASCGFMSSKYRVTKGFKFHAQPQTGAYSCLHWPRPYLSVHTLEIKIFNVWTLNGRLIMWKRLKSKSVDLWLLKVRELLRVVLILLVVLQTSRVVRKLAAKPEIIVGLAI